MRQSSITAPRRAMKITSGLAATALLVAACGGPDDNGGSSDGDTDTDTDAPSGEAAFVWAVTGADQHIHEAVAELWNEQNPDQRVEVFFLAPTADEQRQALFQDLQTGTGDFDVLGLDVIWTGEFADYGYIESLEDYRSEVEGASLEGAINSSEWQAELFALPYSSNGAFLYYRTDLVDEPPTTWDELLDVGLAAAEEAGISGYVAQGDQYEGFVVNYLELFWSAGGELFDAGQQNSTFLEGDAAEVAIDWLIEAREEGLLANGFDSMVEDDARALFQAGDAVFMRNWPYAIPLLEDESDSEVAGNFAVAPLPTFTGEGTTSALGGLNNAVSALSENPEVAREFVVWAATDSEAQQILIDNSLPPTLLSAYDGVDDPDLVLLGEVLAQAYARPPVPGYNSLSLAIQDNLHPAFRGQADVDSALEQVDVAANNALEQE